MIFFTFYDFFTTFFIFIANGYGRMIHADGDMYEGQWKDDKAYFFKRDIRGELYNYIV